MGHATRPFNAPGEPTAALHEFPQPASDDAAEDE